MTPNAETIVGTGLAILGGTAFALVFYFVLSRMFNVPNNFALPTAVIIGGIQYFALRYWLLVGGSRK